jgi:hypothetical protein
VPLSSGISFSCLMGFSSARLGKVAAPLRRALSNSSSVKWATPTSRNESKTNGIPSDPSAVRTTHDVQVHVRCGDVAGVTKQAQLVARPNFVPDPDLDVSSLHVRIEAVEPVAMVDNDGVAVDPRDAPFGERAGVGQRAWLVILKLVECSHYDAVARCPNLRPIVRPSLGLPRCSEGLLTSIQVNFVAEIEAEFGNKADAEARIACVTDTHSALSRSSLAFLKSGFHRRSVKVHHALVEGHGVGDLLGRVDRSES